MLLGALRPLLSPHAQFPCPDGGARWEAHKLRLSRAKLCVRTERAGAEDARRTDTASSEGSRGRAVGSYVRLRRGTTRRRSASGRAVCRSQFSAEPAPGEGTHGLTPILHTLLPMPFGAHSPGHVPRARPYRRDGYVEVRGCVTPWGRCPT